MKAERDAAKRDAAESKKRADDLELATKSDTEKAIAQAKKDGSAEATAKLAASIRRSEVKAALTAAGLTTMLDLAVRADEFVDLKVGDDGEVDGLAPAVEAFRKSHADLFKAAPAPGSADGGARGNGKTISRDQIKTMSPAEINAAFERGELEGLLKPTR